MNTCDTCKWWNDKGEKEKDYHSCNHSKVGWGDIETNGLKRSDEFDTLTFTGPKFGCVHHEQKQTMKSALTKEQLLTLLGKDYQIQCSCIPNISTLKEEWKPWIDDIFIWNYYIYRIVRNDITCPSEVEPQMAAVNIKDAVLTLAKKMMGNLDECIKQIKDL